MKKDLTKEELLTLLEEHSDEVVAVVFKNVHEETTTVYASGSDPVMQLPDDLRGKLIPKYQNAFKKAFDQNLLCYKNGRIKSFFRSPGALAYFLGRCFSGDKPCKVLKYRVWKRGDIPFPATGLNALFGKKNIWELRRNNSENKNFHDFEVVDNLFVEDD